MNSTTDRDEMMNGSLVWDIQATKQKIFDLYGKEQMALARPSFNSLVDRREFARYHFHEAMDRWDLHLDDIKDSHPIEVALGTGDDETENRRATRMHELGAHVQACVHSLHTIPDIMAHGIYYALAFNRSSPLRERDVSAKSVTKKLAADGSLRDLHDLFEAMYSAGDFAYLDSLNNHGKHRSLIRAAIWSDLTGKAEKSISLQFSEFSYGGTNYEGREIRATLTNEYERISRAFVDCGVELLHILNQRAQNGA